jgi:hypothetical protein
MLRFSWLDAVCHWWRATSPRVAARRPSFRQACPLRQRLKQVGSPQLYCVRPHTVCAIANDGGTAYPTHAPHRKVFDRNWWRATATA